MSVRKVPAEALARRCDPQSLDFETTADLAELGEVVGQPRAVAALEFGIGSGSPGFNVFVLGPPGTGRHFVARQFLERHAAGQPVPDDWAYVHNFEDEHRPRALRLPAGSGTELRRDLKELVEDLQTALATAFESEDYQTRRETIDQELKERQEKAFHDLGAQAEQRGLLMLRTPLGFMFAPARAGEVIPPQEFEALPAEERQRLEAAVEQLRAALEKIVHQLPRWQRERRERVRELNRDVARFAVGGLMEDLRSRYRHLEQVIEHLNAVESDIVEAAPGGAGREGGGEDPPSGPLQPRRYQINLLVDHGGSRAAPVVYADNPTFTNLMGRVEHLSQLGTLVTDFTLIKPGALHRANGGFLVLDALQVLREPFAWEGLKRALRSGQLRIESLGQALSLVSTLSLEPEPIPLSLKVVLVGDRLLYYLLSSYDPDFPGLFKVAADFDDQERWTAESQPEYARLLATLARRGGLASLDRSAVARLLEASARDAGDGERLSLRTAALLDLMSEADFWRQRAGRDAIVREDVERAIAAREGRADRVRERLLEETLAGRLRIATDGTEVGQVNGLSVVQLGGFAFGHPSRITARVRVGEGEVIDVEREVELSGPIHSKGVLILSGFLGARYAPGCPLSLAASLVFEQSYGGVEGDSASLAELAALLSAIGEIPLRQGLAVTGSVNQHGEVQAVGGVNEKIEGFFDLCRARGLTGDQGVVVPAAIVPTLMLRADVVEAAREDRFRIIAVDNVDEAMTVLTGLPAGERGPDGVYPDGTVNEAVEMRLLELAAARQAFSRTTPENVPA